MCIIHLGVSGFPYGNANIQRILLTFRSLKEGGYSPLIINRRSLHKNEIKIVNKFNGIPYINTSYRPYKPKNVILGLINNISGHIGEFVFLWKKRKSIDTAIFYSPKFLYLLYYRCLSKLFGFKLIVQYVEFRSSIPSRQTFYYKFNDYLFERYCSFMCDGVIVISEFLKQQVIDKNPKLPWIKLPAITDFSAFRLTPFTQENNYIMYCGGIEYFPVIDFVMELYEKIRDSTAFKGKLMFVIGGDDLGKFDQLEENIRTNKYNDSIILKRNLGHKDLLPIYLSSYVLLIPLRNTIQDIARFPHKISEYTASGRPILTTDIGDISYYFENEKSAILAEEYSVDSYCKALSKVIGQETTMDLIGREGLKVGENYFNYKAYSGRLKDFLSTI